VSYAPKIVQPVRLQGTSEYKFVTSGYYYKQYREKNGIDKPNSDDEFRLIIVKMAEEEMSHGDLCKYGYKAMDRKISTYEDGMIDMPIVCNDKR
jgi:hypothetical protein